MKKRIIVVAAVLLMAIGSSFGQIIYTSEDDPNQRDGQFGVMVPIQNANIDQYKLNEVPLGSGWLLLAGLGGAYLLRKRKGESGKLKVKSE